MSEDKELVGFWQSEFEKLMPNANLSKHPEGDYVRDPIDAMWRGFLMAKRSQPIVILPNQINCEGVYFDLNGYEAEEIHERLTAAGIKYIIGE